MPSLESLAKSVAVAAFSLMYSAASAQEPPRTQRSVSSSYGIAEQTLDVARKMLQESRNISLYVERNTVEQGKDYLVIASDRDLNGCPEVKIMLPLKGALAVDGIVRVTLDLTYPVHVYVDPANSSSNPAHDGIHLLNANMKSDTYLLKTPLAPSSNRLYRPTEIDAKCT
jgi:hypothetical protein